MLREEKYLVEPLSPLNGGRRTQNIDETQRREEEQASTTHRVTMIDRKKSKNENDVRTKDTISSVSNGLSFSELEVLRIAACLGSFDETLWRSCTFLLEEHLEAAVERNVMKCVNGVYSFSRTAFEQEIYQNIPLAEKRKLHLTLGRSLVENLSQDELERHFYTVLLQFRCGLEAITSQSERSAIAVLCLQATRVAVAASDFEAACDYSDFGIMLLSAPNHWNEEYDLSLALYNDAAEVFHLSANYKRVDELITAVMENARSYQDTLRVRSTRVNSLSSTNRLTEALEEGLDTLRHLGVKIPPKARMRHVSIEFLRTRRLLRGKTNEAVLRMPLMVDADNIAAMQMLNLLFPVAYRIDRVLFTLINLRLVRLTLQYGLSAISTVGFAAYSVMLVTLYRDKEEGFRYSQLALDLLDKFDVREYISRTYFFVYAEAYTFKYEIRHLCPYLQKACELGLQSGDVQYALYNSTLLEFGYMLFSGASTVEAVEEKMREYYKTAIRFKQDTALATIRPCLKFLGILMGKDNVPILTAFKEDLKLANAAKDEFASWAIHFFQLLLAFIFNEYDTAADEANALEHYMKLHLHPGFSGVLTSFCLSRLTEARQKRGLARRRLLSSVKTNMKKLKNFSECVPENCLHKLHFVQAELAIVNGDNDLAKRKYESTFTLASEVDVPWMRALASERFGIFLQDQGDEPGAICKFRKAYTAYHEWGATAKAHQLERRVPTILVRDSTERASVSTQADTIGSDD
jgi:hypothetical protein